MGNATALMLSAILVLKEKMIRLLHEQPDLPPLPEPSAAESTFSPRVQQVCEYLRRVPRA